MKKTIEEQVAELTPEQRKNLLYIDKKAALWEICGASIAYLLGILCYAILPEMIGLNIAFLCGTAFLVVGMIWALGVLLYVKKKYPYYSAGAVKHVKKYYNKDGERDSDPKGKKSSYVGKIVLLYVLMFMVTAGQNAQAYLDAGVEYNEAYTSSLLSALITLVVLSAVMMAVPLVCKLVCSKLLAEEKGKKLCMWNSIAVFVLSFLLYMMEIPIPVAVGGVGALCFYFINKWIFVESGK